MMIGKMSTVGHLELWDKTMTNCDKKIKLEFNHLCIFSTDNSSFHGYPEPIKCPNENLENQ